MRHDRYGWRKKDPRAVILNGLVAEGRTLREQVTKLLKLASQHGIRTWIADTAHSAATEQSVKLRNQRTRWRGPTSQQPIRPQTLSTLVAERNMHREQVTALLDMLGQNGIHVTLADLENKLSGPRQKGANSAGDPSNSQAIYAASPFAQRKTEGPQEDRRLVYGCFPFGTNGQLIIMRESVATYLANVLHVLRTARTWGDVKAALSRSDFQALAQDFIDDEREEAFLGARGQLRKTPKLDAPFDNDYVLSESGVERWIGDPTAAMRKWLPQEMQTRYGKFGDDTTCNSLSLWPEHEDKIVAELRGLGFEISRNDLLVSATWDPEDAKLVVSRTVSKR